jgi:hypothetical protein
MIPSAIRKLVSKKHGNCVAHYWRFVPFCVKTCATRSPGYVYQLLSAIGTPSLARKSINRAKHCFSALITLYENASKGRQSKYSLSAEIELRELGISGLQSLVPMLAEYALHIQTIISYNLDQASPLIANCLYRMAVSISEMTNDSTNQDYLITLNSVKETLSKLSPRWNVAGMQVRLLN